MGTSVQGLGGSLQGSPKKNGEKMSWRQGEALTPKRPNLRASPRFLACVVQILGTLDCFQMPLE